MIKILFIKNCSFYDSSQAFATKPLKPASSQALDTKKPPSQLAANSSKGKAAGDTQHGRAAK
jgi:hypothetical protein